MERCRSRFMQEGSGQQRITCICSVLTDAKEGSGGDLPDVGNWPDIFQQLKCVGIAAVALGTEVSRQLQSARTQSDTNNLPRNHFGSPPCRFSLRTRSQGRLLRQEEAVTAYSRLVFNHLSTNAQPATLLSV